MRQRTAYVSEGHLDRHRVGLRPLLIGLAVALIGAWVAVLFSQQIISLHALNARSAALAAQNQQLAAINQGYRQDIADVQSGAAAQEEARQNGYARSDEKLYLITAPSPGASPVGTKPRPAPTVEPRVSVSASATNPLSGLADWLRRHL